MTDAEYEAEFWKAQYTADVGQLRSELGQLRGDVADAIEAARMRGLKTVAGDGRPFTLIEIFADFAHSYLNAKAALRDAQGREAAMRAALETLIEQWDADEIGQVDGEFIDDARSALATDSKGWVSPETMSGLVEALKMAQSAIREIDVGHAQTVVRERIESSLAAFEKRGGK